MRYLLILFVLVAYAACVSDTSKQRKADKEYNIYLLNKYNARVKTIDSIVYSRYDTNDVERGQSHCIVYDTADGLRQMMTEWTHRKKLFLTTQAFLDGDRLAEKIFAGGSEKTEVYECEECLGIDKEQLTSYPYRLIFTVDCCVKPYFNYHKEGYWVGYKAFADSVLLHKKYQPKDLPILRRMQQEKTAITIPEFLSLSEIEKRRIDKIEEWCTRYYEHHPYPR